MDDLIKKCKSEGMDNGGQKLGGIDYNLYSVFLAIFYCVYKIYNRLPLPFKLIVHLIFNLHFYYFQFVMETLAIKIGYFMC